MAYDFSQLKNSFFTLWANRRARLFLAAIASCFLLGATLGVIVGILVSIPMARYELYNEVCPKKNNFFYIDAWLKEACSKKDSTPPAQYVPQTLDTAGWQTYRNEEFGFEFRYPQSVKVEEPTPEAASTSLFVLQLSFPSKVNLYEGIGFLLIYNGMDNIYIDNFDLKGYIHSAFNGEPEENFSFKGISGFKAGESYFFQKDAFVYVAYIWGSLDKSGDSYTLGQILSTFRFVE